MPPSPNLAPARKGLPPNAKIVWEPQPGPQMALVTCPVFEVFFGGARFGGKCLPLDEPVLTPFGWRPMGDIRVGDQVSNPDGSTSRVIALYRPGRSKLYRLTFSDGASVRCDGGHIWAGRFQGHRIKRDLGGLKLFTTDQLIAKLERCPGSRFHIPLTNPVSFQRPRITKHGDSRPLDPYILGVLLGDGSLTQKGSVRYATADPEIDAEMARFGTVRVDDGPNRRLIDCQSIKDGIEKLGLWGKGSLEKFIPDAYLWASVEDRFALVQGLMDTDGSADDNGRCHFYSSSRRLIADMQHLLWSLGYRAKLKEKPTPCAMSYQLHIQGPDKDRLFRLPRKASRAAVGGSAAMSQRRLVSIEECGEGEVACFQVDNPNSLFITKDFIVTHNTEASLGDWIAHSAQYGELAIGVFIRRKAKDLHEVIQRAKQLFFPLGAKWNGTDKEFTMPGGARLKFSYCERDDDAEQYQGGSFTRIYIEEAGQFPSIGPINKIRGACRSGAGVPCGMRLTGNPGGPGQAWIKERYIDPCPSGYKVITETDTVEIDGRLVEVKIDRVFIPSKITDNRLGLRNDPAYVMRLKQSGSEALVRAWLDGDWNAIEGAYFDEWSETKHVLHRSWLHKIPDHAMRFRSFDWGHAKPFSVGWWAVSDGTWGLPNGALLRYREWYGAKSANVGLRMSNDLIAQGILEREKGERISYGVADPSIFIQSGGPSIAEQMLLKGCSWRAADNSRIAGWTQCRMRLQGENGLPMVYVLDTCVDLIRTLPMMQHDENHEEDLDSEGEDHCFVPDTVVMGYHGPIRIAEMGNIPPKVYSAGGEVKLYRSARMTQRQARVVRLCFSSGATVTCTPNHRFLSPNGWVQAKDLAGKTLYPFQKKPRSMEASDTTSAGIISSAKAFASTARSGLTQTGQFLTGFMSTIATRTVAITLWGTWSSSLSMRICQATPRQSEELRPGRWQIDTGRWRLLGMARQKALSGTSGTMRLSRTAFIKLLSWFADIAVRRLSASPSQGIAPTSASPQLGGRLALMMRKGYALFAQARSVLTGIQRRALVRVLAAASSRQIGGVECISVEDAGSSDVYCITVPDGGCFALGNGLIVSNCADEFRYAMMSRPYIQKAPPTTEFVPPPTPAQMTFQEVVQLNRRRRLSRED